MFYHVVILEFIEFMFRIKSCYAGDPDGKPSTSELFMLKFKRRIPLIKTCLENV